MFKFSRKFILKLSFVLRQYSRFYFIIFGLQGLVRKRILPFLLSRNKLTEVAEKKQFQYLNGRISELLLNKQTSESQSTIFPFEILGGDKLSKAADETESNSGALQILCDSSVVGNIIGNPIFFPHLGIQLLLSNTLYLCLC